MNPEHWELQFSSLPLAASMGNDRISYICTGTMWSRPMALANAVPAWMGRSVLHRGSASLYKHTPHASSSLVCISSLLWPQPWVSPFSSPIPRMPTNSLHLPPNNVTSRSTMPTHLKEAWTGRALPLVQQKETEVSKTKLSRAYGSQLLHPWLFHPSVHPIDHMQTFFQK